MKKIFPLLLILLLFVGCSEDDKDPVEPQKEQQDPEKPQGEQQDSINTKKAPKLAILDISKDTENADILFLAENGCYILCDVENSQGYSVIYVNESLDNEFEDGLTLLLDEDGVPAMASTAEGHFVFKNVRDDCFDFAFIDNKDEITLFYDVKLDSLLGASASTRSILDPWIDAFKHPLGGVRDEHNMKALVPFAYKLLSFLITAVDAVKGTGQFSLITTIVSEFYKSSDIESEFWDEVFCGLGATSLSTSGFDLKEFLKSGTIKFTKFEFGLSYLADLINKYADEELEKLGKYEGSLGPIYNPEEWKITLSTNLLEVGPDDEWHLVDVSSKAKWDIDVSKIDNSWCEVTKLDLQVAVHVTENKNDFDRACSLTVYVNNSSRIEPVVLTIKQSGIVFTLSEEKLSFEQKGGSKGVNVTTNDNIDSWSVTSYPSWCKIEKGENVFFVDVDECDETRDGIITVTALTKGGISVDRQLIVEQIVKPLCPDNNHPHAIDLGLPSGTKWSCCNVGASSPEGYGGYYAWGETSEKAVYNDVTYQYASGIDEDGDGHYDDWHRDTGCYGVWQNLGDISGTSYDVAHVKWGGGWRMPTLDQIKELVNNCTSQWTTLNGVYGREFTGRNGGKVFLPAAGFRWYDYLYEGGSYGYCWSSTQLPDDGRYAYDLYFTSGRAGWYNFDHRIDGRSVRPVSR